MVEGTFFLLQEVVTQCIERLMRISIYDAVSIPLLLVSTAMACGVLYLLYRREIIRSFFDPAIWMLFQVSFTFFILLGTGLMDIVILVSYGMFCFGIVYFRKVTLFHGKFASEHDWIYVIRVVIIISIISNVILLSTKGFILLKADPQMEKLQFFQNAGIFKRINDIAAPLCGVMAIYFFFQKRKMHGIILAVYTAFLLLSSGSKSGLLAATGCIGAYLHFYPVIVRKKVITFVVLGGILSSLVIFQLSFGAHASEGIYRRFVAFADGPFYFYNGDLSSKIDYPVDYPLDQLLVNLKVQEKLKYLTLGPNIIKNYFGDFNPLMGPNPQFMVEATTVFGDFFYVYCFIIGALFMVLRNSASNPFSFILLSIFFVPMLIDIQYAMANLVTLSLIVPILLIVKFLKSLSSPSQKPLVDGQ
jgi:hypothetical protein